MVGVLSVGLISGYQNTADLLRQKAELLIASERDLTRTYLGRHALRGRTEQVEIYALEETGAAPTQSDAPRAAPAT